MDNIIFLQISKVTISSEDDNKNKVTIIVQARAFPTNKILFTFSSLPLFV